MINNYKIADFIVQIRHNNDELFRYINDELKFYGTKELQIGDALIEINAGNDDFTIPKKAVRIFSNKPGIKVRSDGVDYILRPDEALIVMDFRRKRVKINYVIANANVLLMLRWAVKWLIIKTAENKGLAYIHGAAVRYKGKNIVFAGDSGSGKSSCLLRMLRAGAQLISDDNTFVDPRIIPFSLKPAVSKDLIKRFQIKGQDEEVYKHHIQDSNIGMIDLLILLKVWHHDTSEVTPVMPDDAVAELENIYFREMKITEIEVQDKNISIQKYRQAIGSARCFTLYAGNDEEEVKETLLNFIENLK
ncbi:hypothetical protein KY345_04115 [Candidatus Woesearchaeota archaeon]|nr:hypothetical protein [Candidatus Woesearchaeota archaeon]